MNLLEWEVGIPGKQGVRSSVIAASFWMGFQTYQSGKCRRLGKAVCINS